MKYTITILLLLLSLAATAQTGIFLAGEVGLGSSNLTDKPNYIIPGTYQQHVKSQDAVTAVVNVGVYTGQWEFKAGIGYLRDGYILTYDNPSASSQIYRDRVFYPHLIIPVSTGWVVPLNRRWGIVPHWGVTLGTNTGRSDLSDERTNMSGSDFNNYYTRQGIWVSFDIEARCRIGRRHFLFAAPHYNMMVTDMARNVNTVPEQNSVLLNSFTVNVGIARVFELKAKQ